MFIALTFAMAKPFGAWLFALYEGRTPKYLGFLAPVERALYRAGGVDPGKEQGWRGYAIAMLVFSAVGIFLTYAIERLQFYLPLNPQGFAGVPAPVAFNTAVSFITNTNWQSYAGESTMSNFTQMVGLAVHNFLSAATGIAIAFALIRGFARREAKGIGNFWADMTRITLYILLPISVVYALVLVALGIPQTLAGSVTATTMEGAKQVIALGPVASQIAIKMLGTNGGGFFNANAAHPYENPGDISNFIQMLSIFALGAGLTWTFGKAVGNAKQGWAILAAMMILMGAGVTTAYIAESAGNPIHHAMGVDASHGQHGRQGSALRHCRLGLVRDGHDRCLVRRGQFDARQLHADRRVRAAVQHPARRDHHRRRRFRSLRFPAVRHPLDLRRRPDGRHGRQNMSARRSRAARSSSRSWRSLCFR